MSDEPYDHDRDARRARKLMREHVVYSLNDPRDESERYVGMTSAALEYRLMAHVENAVGLPWRESDPIPVTRKDCWIVALDRIRESPFIIQLEIVAPDKAYAAEARWIEHFRAKDAFLTNSRASSAGPCPWRLPPLTDEERLARCADPDYDLKKGR